MKKRAVTKKKRIFYTILNAALALVSIACIVVTVILSSLLDSQKAAQRWQGESQTEFSQVSCYIPVDEKISLEQVYTFRNEIVKRLNEAALDVDTDDTLFIDAWSTTGKLSVSTSLGSGEASVIAVGGRFFDFHPIRLISGSYITESDLMQDRVLLDEDLAWLLFGGLELEGLEMRINGVPFVVAGVIEREVDFASEKAYTAGMGLYMSYDAYAAMVDTAGINCYELVMAEPVEGFTQAFAMEKFPIGQGEIVSNTGRYSFGRMIKLAGDFGTRSMQTLGVVYPYWENAARCIEDWCALFLFLGLLTAALPLISVTLLIVHYLRRGKNKLSDDILPQLKDKTQEAVRVRQRRSWEKRHGRHE